MSLSVRIFRPVLHISRPVFPYKRDFPFVLQDERFLRPFRASHMGGKADGFFSKQKESRGIYCYKSGISVQLLQEGFLISNQKSSQAIVYVSPG